MRNLALVSALLFLNIIFDARADVPLVELIQRIQPAVATVVSFDKNNNPVRQGSGFFVDPKGVLITNKHVIQGAHAATVKLASGQLYLIEGVLAIGTDSDIVKLRVKLDGKTTPFMTPADLTPQVGEDIVVIGSPLGLEATVSRGIVSAIRNIPAIGNVLQISAPLSPGSSGSPVLNMKGQVVGVATFILKEGQALNFAIPSKTILELSPENQPVKLSEIERVVALIAQARLKYNEKDSRGALKELEELLKLKPNHAEALELKKKIEIELNVPLLRPDGKIVLLDDKAKVVYLNAGSNDRVCQGLTFTVYDRGTNIQENSKGKAAIEVFDVAKTSSAARIIHSQIGRPIQPGDIIGNLIWDRNKTNVFVIAGDFDTDGDGYIDLNAIDRIKRLIETWGGRVDNQVSADTDLVVLGESPHVPPKLNSQELFDPVSKKRYEVLLQKFRHYNDVQHGAKTLQIPIFTCKQFFSGIGYKVQIKRTASDHKAATRDNSLMGVVTAVDVKNLLIQISIGATNGVREGMRFHATRNSKFICDIVILVVEPQKAIGCLELLQEQSKDLPKIGDNVSTGL